MNEYDLTDLIVSAIEQKPNDFESAFNGLIVDRIRSAVEDKKIEIAQQMYGYEPEETEDNSEEEIDVEESE